MSNDSRYTTAQPPAPQHVDDCWLELVADPELLDGSFSFQPMVRYRTKDDDRSRAVWSAIDAIVIKAIAMVLGVKRQ